MTSEVVLVVGGKSYGGWKSIRVTRSIETIAASFDLEVSDRWTNQGESWPIREEDACLIKIGRTAVVDGYVDRRSLAIDAKSRSLSYGGKDKTAALVECSVILERWSFKNISVLEFARKVCEPFGIRVRLGVGVALPFKPPRKTVINPGDTPFEALERAARAAGVLLVSDSAGGIVLARSGLTKCNTSLVEGVNVLAASVDYDATGRFARYVVATQIPGTDESSGAATRVRAEASDEGVRRSDRVLLVTPGAGISADSARVRGDWEARVRAARAETVSVTVVGWEQPSGQLWPVNETIPVKIPSIGVDGEMLIAGTEFSAGADGTMTRFSLVRPDAFTPEPIAAKVKASGGLWKELRNGAL